MLFGWPPFYTASWGAAFKTVVHIVVFVSSTMYHLTFGGAGVRTVLGGGRAWRIRSQPQSQPQILMPFESYCMPDSGLCA